MAKATYKSAGVDLEQYREAMARLPRLLHRTFSPRVLPWEGGFAGLLRLDFPDQLFARRYQEPVLVAATDGVGTKLKVAQAADRHHTVGIDLVAMSVNDALCCGAEPLLFLDYVAMAQDDPPRLEQIVQGVSEGCIQADCALLGGETAILPDLYQPGEYDLAGFCLGVVEKRDAITGQAIALGDTILGLASSGLHSNGYSLVRRVVFDQAGVQLDDFVEPLGRTVADELLEPTRIYVQPVRRILHYYQVKNVVHGLAHITGGGLADNVQRILPASVDAEIDPQAWDVPAVFPWLQQLGPIDRDEMRRVFNMGIGLVMVVAPYYASNIQRMVEDTGVRCWPIGRITAGTGQVVYVPDE